MFVALLILVLHASVLNTIESARILAVFPVPSISHQVVFRPLTQELAKRGHEVTVITPNPAFHKGESPPNLTEIDVHDLSYNIWRENFMKSVAKGNKGDLEFQTKLILETFAIVFDAQLRTEEVEKILSLKNDSFDLLLLEACVRPALGFAYAFKAPVILLSSLGATPGNFELVGASEHPILYPMCLHQRVFNLTLWEKISQIYHHYRTLKIYENNESIDNEILKKNFGPHIPSVQELGNNVDLLMLNFNPVFGGKRPVPPNVIYMGGLHQIPSKPLPNDLKQYLDSSKNGVVYVSFGTNVDSTMLPAEKVQVLVRAFSKLPYDILFKWDNEELPGRSDNVKISKWLPQSDLLKHPKIKVFITQGGLQSTDEAITAGVPLIGIPMLGDQWYNVEHYVHHRIGIQLDMETLTEEQLQDAITTIVGDESYRNNVIKLRALMWDQPMKPLERAVWWTEHVLRHGGAKHMRDPAANISWAQYIQLDLVLLLLGVVLSVITIFICSIFLLCKYFLSSKVKSKQKNN